MGATTATAAQWRTKIYAVGTWFWNGRIRNINGCCGWKQIRLLRIAARNAGQSKKIYSRNITKPFHGANIILPVERTKNKNLKFTI
jgi:hypothetical protein